MALRTSKLWITTRKEKIDMGRIPIHPGEILADELEELNISAAQLARTIGVPPNRISQIIAAKRSISADTAIRLGRYFRMEADFWMNLQKIYDLDLARQELGSSIKRIPQRPNAPVHESA
jgi:addiction module HigA family antidote